MDIRLHNVGKQFKDNWIFRNLNFSFSEASRSAIIGPNGSGKSTLAQILCGITLPSEGMVEFEKAGRKVDISEIYRYVSYAAPYVDLFNSLTLDEMLKLHSRFRSFKRNLQTEDLLDMTGLKTFRNRPIEVLSSGMKQKVKLALSILSESDLLFLDEPHTNLDDSGKLWYRDLMKDFSAGETVVVCSNNVPAEYEGCDSIYQLQGSNSM